MEADSEEAVFAEALAAVAELLGDEDGPPVTHELDVAADERELLLVEWLSELVYLSETEQFVPERARSLELDERRLRANVEGHRGEPSQLVKAVTLHRLEFGRDDTGTWRARVVLDV